MKCDLQARYPDEIRFFTGGNDLRRERIGCHDCIVDVTLSVVLFKHAVLCLLWVVFWYCFERIFFCVHENQVIHRQFIKLMNWTCMIVVRPSPGSRASPVRIAASSRNSPDDRPAFLTTIFNNGLGLNSQSPRYGDFYYHT